MLIMYTNDNHVTCMVRALMSLADDIISNIFINVSKISELFYFTTIFGIGISNASQ